MSHFKKSTFAMTHNGVTLGTYAFYCVIFDLVTVNNVTLDNVTLDNVTRGS